jgi:hypothetical protein
VPPEEAQCSFARLRPEVGDTSCQRRGLDSVHERAGRALSRCRGIAVEKADVPAGVKVGELCRKIPLTAGDEWGPTVQV